MRGFPSPAMDIHFRVVMPRAHVPVATGCATTSMVRAACGLEIVLPVCRLRKRLSFRRSLSNLLLETRGDPGTPATPVPRIRYHWLPLASSVACSPAVSRVVHQLTPVFPSGDAAGTGHAKGAAEIR